MTDAVETGFDIGFQNPLCGGSLRQYNEALLAGIVQASLLSKAIFIKSIPHIHSHQSTKGTSVHFRVGQSLNPYAFHYRRPFASSPVSSTQSLRLHHWLPSSFLKALRHCHVLHEYLSE
jgi:hypothetical protein